VQEGWALLGMRLPLGVVLNLAFALFLKR